MLFSLQAAAVLTLVSADANLMLLDFSMPHCRPCQAMAPVIDALESRGYPVRHVNVAEEGELAAQFGVTAAPTFVLLRDGQEVERQSGAIAAASLVEMFQRHSAAKAPTGAPPLGGPVRAPNGSAPVISVPDLGAASGGAAGAPPSNGFNRPSPTARAMASPPPAMAMPPAMAAPPAPPRMAASPAPAPQPAVRGVSNAASASPSGPARFSSPQANAMQSTVRLQVRDGAATSCATGTIIDVHGDAALVLTCGHVFRDSNGQGAIQVELFAAGAPQVFAGRLIQWSNDPDVALVSFRPGAEVAVSPVASSATYREQDLVFNIGCDKGQDPRLKMGRVTGVDRYVGSPNIVVSDQPVQGRSGGGLFNLRGELIGVCNAADQADDEGIYAGLPSVHWQLDRVGQTVIYQRSAPAASQVAAAPGEAANPTRIPLSALPSGAGAARLAPRNEAGALRTTPVGNPAGGGGVAEIVCILRDPQGGQQLLVVPRPSADFVARLRSEAAAETPNRRTPSPTTSASTSSASGMSASSGMPASGMPAAGMADAAWLEATRRNGTVIRGQR